MAAPFALDPSQEDPYAVAGALPGAGPVPAPEPTVMTPLGQLPASALPPDAGAVGAASPFAIDNNFYQPPGPDGSTPGPAQPGAAAAAPLPSPDQAAHISAAPAAEGAGPPGAAPGAGPAAAAAPLVPPKEPALTGDDKQDLKNSLQYQRDLRDFHTQQLAAATSTANDINTKAAQKQLELDKAIQVRKDQENARAQAALAEQRQAIADHTRERADAIGDIQSGKWRGDQTTGAKISSIIGMALSGIGQAFSAAAGHPTENLAMKAIDERMDREYKIAKDRVDNANEAIQQARYGYKDAEDNHRAALNDIDADQAAKYRLISDEAAAQLRAKGVAPEMIAQNELVTAPLAKSAQHEDDIHMREIEAGRKAELTGSQIKRNEASAEASDALARWRDRRTDTHNTKGGAGRLSKAGQKAQTQELKDIEAAAKPYISDVEGSARSPGIKTSYQNANSVVAELKRALASGDPNAMKIAVLHAQEQSTRFLTGAAPTQQTFEIQHELAGSPDQLEAKLGGMLGQPTEARKYVARMVQNIQAIADQRKEVLEEKRKDVGGRLGSIATSDAGRKRAEGIMTALFGKEASAGEQAKKTQKVGDAYYEFGSDGNWHRVK